MTGDGWPDIFLAGRGGGNRLFVNDGKGRFREAANLRKVFEWTYPCGDDNTCGVCMGDVTGDGLADIVVGQHFDHPWRDPVRIRLYVNRGMKDGMPVFEDVTEAAGLKPLAMKGPHVEIQDFDNDGRPDIYVSIVKFAGGKPHPVIFRNLGVRDGIPRFRDDAWGVNDFPTKEDISTRRSGALFQKIMRERTIEYYAPGPSGDYDNDGRLDLLLVSWWMESRTLLLRNETKAGNWLQVRVRGGKGVNRMGIGSIVNVYPPGRLGDASARIVSREISVGYGYASGQDARAHLGLGKLAECDLEIILPQGKGRLERKGVAANQLLVVQP